MQTREEIEDRLKAEWDRNAALRNEFQEDFESYVAFRLAEVNGCIKMLGGKK